MISYVRGEVIEKTARSLVVLVGGLGLDVFLPEGTLHRAPASGKQVSLYTYLHVREDVLQLYGFDSASARDLFIQLMSVSGFGPQKALAVFSVFSPDGFIKVIHDGDALELTRIPGVGKKSAQRLMLEMRDKVGLPTEELVSLSEEQRRSLDEAAAVLEELGYSRPEAYRALKAYPFEEKEPAVEEMLRFALKNKARELTRQEVPGIDR